MIQLKPDEKAIIKNEGRADYVELHRKHRANILDDILLRLQFDGKIRHSNKAIDIGACEGGFANIIDGYFAGTTALEPDMEKCKYIKNNYPRINVINSTIEKLKESYSNQYDCAVCLEVIEHCDNDKLAVKKIHEILTPGGIAIISMPNKWTPIYFIANALEKLNIIQLREDIKLHFKYSIKDIEKLFTDAGFKILNRRGYNVFIYGKLANSKILDWLNNWFSKIRHLTQYYYLVLEKNDEN